MSDTINYDQLINMSKECYEKYPLMSEFYLNLFKQTECSDVTSILNSYSLLSYIQTKQNKKYYNLVNYAEEALKFLDEAMENSDNTFNLIKILYRACSHLSDNSMKFRAMFYLRIGSRIFKKTSLERTQRENFKVFKELVETVNDDIARFLVSRMRFLNDKTEDVDLARKIIKTIGNKPDDLDSGLKPSNAMELDANSTTGDQSRSGDVDYYLLSAKSARSMAHFLENKELKHQNLYLVDNVYELYFSENDNYLGIFPGTIDNSNLIEFVDRWIDPQDEASNVFLKNGLRELSDFLFVEESKYKKLKKVFGSEYDIKRRYIRQHDLIEQNLRRFNLLVLDETLRGYDISEIRIKAIQMSRFDSVSKLKSKILRCVDYVMPKEKSSKHKAAELGCSLKIISYNKEIFDLVYAFAHKEKKFVVDELTILEEATVNSQGESEEVALSVDFLT